MGGSSYTLRVDTTLQDPLVGQMLDGRYRMDARIAVGGMSTVYRALDTRLDRVLAVKVMHPALAADGAFVDRFIREAKSVARLAHPNVVQVFDQGTDRSYVYLAMEYVSGCTLRDVLRERGALRPRAALDVLEPMLAALGAAHRAGFVHRDMKPENVLIGDDGRVKVADFGLVRAVDTVTSTTGAVLGTVSYLAPEQIEHGTADPRVDVYACGVVLYEMLTGGKPYVGETPAQVLYQHLNEDVPPPSAAVPGLAPVLDGLVASATTRDPEARPRDAVELLARIRVARAELTDEQLDAVPPQALTDEAGYDGSGGRDGRDDHRDHGELGRHNNAEDRTSVLPRTPGTGRASSGPDDGVHRTTRLESGPPLPPARTARPRRALIAVVVAVVVLLGGGSGLWYINSGQFTKVPPLLTRTEAQARARLADAGLEVGKVKHAYSDGVRRGTVMGTDPQPGARVRDHSPVTLTISDGPRIVRVPRLDGSRLDQARKAIGQAGLEPGMVTRAFSDEVPKGSVISTDPAAGTERRAGSAVALVVSKGVPVDVPDVGGMDLGEAKDALSEAGLTVKLSEREVNSPYDAGQVAEQSPAADTQAAEGDTVTLTLSKGPRMLVVPDVTGKKTDEARKTLEAAGFEVKEDHGLFGLFGDTVDDQSVEGGDRAPEGSTITISIS